MGRYSVGTRTATGADIGEVLYALWNPHASIALRVVSIELDRQGTESIEVAFHRITTRGTPGATETPDADNHFGRRAAPPSGALLDRGNYSAAPTIENPALGMFKPGVVTGSGFQWDFRQRPIIVDAGTGLAIVVTQAAIAAASDGSFMWDE